MTSSNFLLAPRKSEGACAAAFAFLFCSQQQLKSDNCCTFFLLLFFPITCILAFCFHFWEFWPHTIRICLFFSFFYCLALTRALGIAGAVFSFPLSFFICALGSVHDRSCVGVTSPLRFSPLLCVSFFFFPTGGFSSSPALLCVFHGSRPL